MPRLAGQSIYDGKGYCSGCGTYSPLEMCPRHNKPGHRYPKCPDCGQKMRTRPAAKKLKKWRPKW
jgi:hypothetical protein